MVPAGNQSGSSFPPMSADKLRTCWKSSDKSRPAKNRPLSADFSRSCDIDHVMPSLLQVLVYCRIRYKKCQIRYLSVPVSSFVSELWSTAVIMAVQCAPTLRGRKSLFVIYRRSLASPTICIDVELMLPPTNLSTLGIPGCRREGWNFRQDSVH